MKIEEINIVFGGKVYDKVDYQRFVKKQGNTYNNYGKIAVMLERSPQLLFTLMMLLDKKITYIPIDPDYPRERVDYIIANSAADCLIMDSGLEIRNHQHQINNDIAYILYTSGSTGTPKGVEITRSGLENFVEGVTEKIDFSPQNRIACFTSVSFDIFFLESIMALYKGLTVVLANKSEQRNPAKMARLISDNAVNMIQMTPARMQLLQSYDKNLLCLKNVKEILIGGEAFPLNLLRFLQEKTTAKIYNMYGPTETTIWSSISDLTDKDQIDIGRPIKNTEIYITDNKLNILPDGQTGEICIAGQGLARGYVASDNLTIEKFVNLPTKPGVKIYRSGDIGKYSPDGNIIYLGRIDNQVKIHGHRIELEEIEAHLCQYDGIHNAAVIVTKAENRNKVLKVYYTSRKKIEILSLKNFLLSRLPSYMVPMIYQQVNSFIYTANGKIDRKRILECITINNEQHVLLDTILKRIDGNTIQKKILTIIASYVVANDFTENFDEADFNSLGIDSVAFVKMIIDIENEFNFEFDIKMLANAAFPSVGAMLDYVIQEVERLNH